ncbi:MAG: YggS family pyridoxal phosphate-dependent enzyme [Firmicutes bacterium]|nr:YggS family pyridoxal phosphate-dependent enzyme [Bacillota bacterium]
MIDTEALKKIRAEVGEGVTIIAATKNVPAEVVDTIKNHGILFAGENRAQEFLSKFGIVTGVDWHFIGRLQTNKVRLIADKVTMIQSVDRRSLADEIQKQCARLRRVMDVLIEVNRGEESKGGVSADEIFDLAEYICGLPNLRLKGLMCIPPINCGRESYVQMRDLFEGLKKRFDGIKYLSMGMSADYKIAVECGANMIRPGSVLFGARD